MQTVVVDSSIIIKWLNQDGERFLKQADQLLKDVQQAKLALFAPELARYEVSNVLLKGKQLSPRQFVTVGQTFRSLPITFVVESSSLAQSCYIIAHKSQMTYYDASFLAVAQQLDAVLVTDNLKHQGKYAAIEVIALGEYKEESLG